MKRALFLIGVSAGFVLGARAGRNHYQQIKQAAKTVADSPTTKRTLATAQHRLDTTMDALHRISGQVQQTSREIPSRLVHTTESLRAELAEVGERSRELGTSTLFTAGDLRDEALDAIEESADDAMLDEHGADERNLSE